MSTMKGLAMVRRPPGIKRKPTEYFHLRGRKEENAEGTSREREGQGR